MKPPQWSVVAPKIRVKHFEPLSDAAEPKPPQTVTLLGLSVPQETRLARSVSVPPVGKACANEFVDYDEESLPLRADVVHKPPRVVVVRRPEGERGSRVLERRVRRPVREFQELPWLFTRY